MNLKFTTWGAVLAVALATMAAPALADSDRRGHGHRDHDRREFRQDRRHDRRDYRQASRDYRYDRRHDRRDHRYRAPVRVIHRPVVHHYQPGPRHHGPPPWARGRYVHHYQRPIYVVNDYYGYGLRHPPRGYHWMRDDYGDFLLVAIATGLIADLVLR